MRFHEEFHLENDVVARCSVALFSVRIGWQLLVVEGSGRFADELSAAVRDGQSAKSTDVSEIARSGWVALFHVDDPADKLRRSLREMLGR